MEYIYNLEEWRLKRLQKVVRLVCAILGLTEKQLSTLIVQISDFRGELDVLWKHPCTHTQEAAFTTAWRECGETVAVHRVDENGDDGDDNAIF